MNVTVCQFDGGTTLRALPLAAGLLVAAARRADAPACTFALRTARESPARVVAGLDAPAVLAFSCYAWSTRYSLEVARLAKRRFAAACVILGGPSVPRHADVAHRFLVEHPWVDVLVHGEGEDAFGELLAAVAGGSDVAAIAGLTYRDAAGHARTTAPRPRRQGFADLASPYLDGVFDALLPADVLRASAAVLETNRGCPFACTFCDWGQAVHTPVRELPQARVTAELAWVAARRLARVYVVDANFGIRKRDRTLAREIADLRRTTGYPTHVFFHLTKNARAHHLETVEVLRQAGVGCQVALSMQDFEPRVLRAVRRANIRTTRALELRRLCNTRGIPTMNELLLGLPEQTLASVRRSVLQAITPYPGDTFMLYEVRALENAALAAPAERARHGLETRRCRALMTADAPVPEEEEIVVATRTLPVADWRRAYAFGHLVSATYNLGPLRHVLRFLRQQPGLDLEAWARTVFEAAPRAAADGVLARMARCCARYADAILAGGAQTFPVAGAGPTARPLDDALALTALAEPARLLAEVRAATDVAGAARPSGWPSEAVLDELFRLQALAMADFGARHARVERFQHDWLAWLAGAPLTAEPTALRYRPPAHVLAARNFAHFADQHLVLSYAKALPTCLVRVPRAAATAPPPPWNAVRNRWTSTG